MVSAWFSSDWRNNSDSFFLSLCRLHLAFLSMVFFIHWTRRCLHVVVVTILELDPLVGFAFDAQIRDPTDQLAFLLNGLCLRAEKRI